MAKITTPFFALAVCLGLSAASLAHAQDATIGEIKTFAFDFCPAGKLPTTGNTLSTASNATLFIVIGNTFGSNSTTNFALPNLAGRAMIGDSATTNIGDKAGVESGTLTMSHMPFTFGPRIGVPEVVTTSGIGLVRSGGQTKAVNTMPPYLVMRQCISDTGTSPSSP